MADIIATDLHKKVDALMNRFYGAGVASHPTIIEQINYLLFMRALSYKDDEYRQLGINDSDKIVFDGELEKYRWENLLSLNAEALFIALEECFRKIPESTTNKTVRLVFRNAHIKLYDKPSLRLVVHEIDAFAKSMDESEHEGKRDIFGDTYEYLLSKLAQAGTSGQFRTPRHIIDFLVAVVAPKKGEKILDPAVGTAGFLVKAFEYMRGIYTSPEVSATGGSFDKLSSKELNVLYEHTFNGFDSDEDMIKFGMMNLYLHGLENAQLIRQNTLTDTAGNRDKYDVILANPPFSGKIDRDSVTQELQMNTGATEVLFLRYMIEHLSSNGRAGVIVPEGVLFNSSKAHTKIRQILIENGLWCVVSLPAGVFNPYAGVKTSILFFDRTRAEKQEVLFIKASNDGFSLTAQRKPITKNDLPAILIDIENYKKGENLHEPYIHIINYKYINSSNGFNLSGGIYKLVETAYNNNLDTVTLEDLEKQGMIEFLRGANLSKKQIIPNGMNKCIHYGELYTLYDPIIQHVKSRTNEQGKVFSIAGDVLIPATTTADAMGIAIARSLNEDGVIIGGDINILRTRNKIYLADFLAWLISTELKTQLATYAKGINIIHLSNKDIKKLRVPILPLESQKKIIEEIKKKQKLINEAYENIEILKSERDKILFNELM